MSGTLVRGGEWERFWFVCVCLSKQHTKFLQEKRWNFFQKLLKTRATVLLFSALLSFSLSLCFLSYTRSSLRWREEESSRDEIRVLLLLLLLLQLVLSLLCWGSFITQDDTTAGCVLVVLLSSSSVFSFCCSFWLWAELLSVCALFCSGFFLDFYEHVFYHSFPLYLSKCVNTLKFLSYRNTHIRIERRRWYFTEYHRLHRLYRSHRRWEGQQRTTTTTTAEEEQRRRRRRRIWGGKSCRHVVGVRGGCEKNAGVEAPTRKEERRK